MIDSFLAYQLAIGVLGIAIGLIGFVHLRWLKRKEREEEAASTPAE
ncbi:MAG: hypothetical protein JNJ73_06095 [Hyphomonadaceae bacterium]|nr:hypothetical protein [Hyphomonadaceae bacterium]